MDQIDAEKIKEAKLELFRAVQKSPKLLATGQRAKAPSAAQETLKAINVAANKLLSKSDADLDELTSVLSQLEEAQLWVLDPGSSKSQEGVDVIRAKLQRFQALVENSQSVEGLSKKEKKGEAEKLRIELLGQLVAPQDEERRMLQDEFRDLCDELDRRIARARLRRRSLSSQEEEPDRLRRRDSVLGWLTGHWRGHHSHKEPQAQLQVDVNAPLREWNVTDSFQVKPLPRMEAAAVNRLASDARMLSEASERVASMVQHQDGTLDAIEGEVHQTVEDTREVVGTLADVAVGKSKSRVFKATLGVGASGALLGVACTTMPLWGSVALGTGAATVTALAGRAIHNRFTRKVQEVAAQNR